MMPTPWNKKYRRVARSIHEARRKLADGTIRLRKLSGHPGWYASTPVHSWRKGKKLAVFVRRGKNGRVRVVHFGMRGYADYTMHGDAKRRRSYLARSKAIGGNPYSANFWARKILW